MQQQLFPPQKFICQVLLTLTWAAWETEALIVYTLSDDWDNGKSLSRATSYI